MAETHVSTISRVVFLGLVCSLPWGLCADQERIPYDPNRGVNFTDSAGGRWDLQLGGEVAYGSDNRTFSTAFSLYVNNQNFRSYAQRAYYESRRGGKPTHHKLGTNGIEIGPIKMPQGIWVTRRIEKTKSGWMRFTTIFHNQNAGDATVSFYTHHRFQTNVSVPVRYQQKSSLGQGVIAYCVPQLHQRVSLLQVISSLPKTSIKIERQSSSYARVNWASIKIPAGKKKAVVCFVLQIRKASEASAKLKSFRKNSALQGLPREVREALTNFKAGGAIRGLEIPTAPDADLVVLDNGRSLRGSLSIGQLAVHTAGRIVKVARVDLWGVGRSEIPGYYRFGFCNGQILVGEIATRNLALQLAGGQTLKIPWDRVKSAAFHGARMAKPPSSGFIVTLMQGDRLIVKSLSKPLQAQTRLGPLTLDVGVIRKIILLEENNWGHRLRLVNGSKLGCLLTNKKLELVLISGETVTCSLDSVRSFSSVKPEQAVLVEPGDFRFEMRNGDVLVGRVVSARLTLNSEFGALKLAWRQVKLLSVRGIQREATIELFDGNTLQGLLSEKRIKVTSGEYGLTLPLDLLSRVTQPKQGLTAGLRKKVLDLVKALDAPSFKMREQAQKSLQRMGVVVKPYLEKQLAAGELSVEQKQRIEQVLKALK